MALFDFHQQLLTELMFVMATDPPATRLPACPAEQARGAGLEATSPLLGISQLYAAPLLASLNPS